MLSLQSTVEDRQLSAGGGCDKGELDLRGSIAAGTRDKRQNMALQGLLYRL